MKRGFKRALFGLFMAIFMIVPLAVRALASSEGQAAAQADPELLRLLPKSDQWLESEPPRQYLPESLFEYIDGAAESFLGYDFSRLVVAQYARKGAQSGSLTIEIYDMKEPGNAFGIYSAERYSDSRFLSIGVQGYYEEGSLNFLAGRFYVKMMCYDCGTDAETQMTALASDIASRIAGKSGFPPLLPDFPRKGLVANSEKFVLRNFQGLAFLGNGYQASYKLDSLEFECFIVECADPASAKATEERYLENYRKAGAEIKSMGPGWSFRDKYLLNVFFARQGRFLCGVVRVPDGREDVGRTYLEELVGGLGREAVPPAGTAR